MRTAKDVLNAIDEHLADLEQRGGKVCLDAMGGDYDRDSFREAMNLAAGLKAVKVLRSDIANRIAVTPERSSRRAAGKGR